MLSRILLAPFRWAYALISGSEKLFYWLRDGIWNYPDWLLLDRNSVRSEFVRGYTLSRPYSHFLGAAILILSIVAFSLLLGNVPLLARGRITLIEGVVMGSDQNGRPQRLTKISPLVPSNIQLEKDLSELIYEPLIRYEQGANITPILAENVIRRQEGSEYIFELRQDVYWHDGTKFGLQDVISTLEVMQDLDIQGNTYVQAIKQMAWEQIGENSILICTISEQSRTALAANELTRPCSAAVGEKPILSNFLELISIKIMPKIWIEELNSLTISNPNLAINRTPVGTGKFRFAGSTPESIFLSRNDQYYGKLPQITDIEFKLFANELAAVDALKNGEVHTLATVSTANLREIGSYPQVEEMYSDILGNQYWAIYFNLHKDPAGAPLGPAFFQDVKIRQAITMSINKNKVMEALFQVGGVTDGPISSQSDFYNPKAGWLTYSQSEAIKLMEQSGWMLGEGGWRYKNGQKLSFKLSYAENFDREKTVKSIQQDLAEVGIELIPDPKSGKQLTDEVVSPKIFDSLLYGMHTFVDPDRYELFHSSQITGLNLSRYKGSVLTAQIQGGKTVRVPKADKLLELGRSLDPLAAKDKRLESYFEFQQLLAADAPVVFLYNPKFIYYKAARVTGANLEGAGSLEQRFTNIAEWRIE